MEVSNEAERALKKILESSQKSTNMVRAIARATVEQAKGSKQVTDAIGRIAATVQQIAAATAAAGARLRADHEERREDAHHLAAGGALQPGAVARQPVRSRRPWRASTASPASSTPAQRTQTRGSERALSAAMQIEEAARKQDGALRDLTSNTDRLRRSAGAWSPARRPQRASVSRARCASMCQHLAKHSNKIGVVASIRARHRSCCSSGLMRYGSLGWFWGFPILRAATGGRRAYRRTTATRSGRSGLQEVAPVNTPLLVKFEESSPDWQPVRSISS